MNLHTAASAYMSIINHYTHLIIDTTFYDLLQLAP